MQTKIVPRITLRKNRGKARRRVDRNTSPRYTIPQRNEFSLATEFDRFHSTLYKLRNGKQVFLHLRANPPKTAKRVAAKPKGHKVVILTPMPEYHGVLVSVLGYGSCMVFSQGKTKVADLILAGIPLVEATELAKTLRQVLKEK